VELLAVLAVVGMLAAMLLPALSRARSCSRTSQCVSQLRQLGLTLALYGADNNELLPMAHSIVAWTNTHPVPWTRVLFPQYAPPTVLTCPSYSRVYYQSPFNYFMGARFAFVEAGAQPASVALRRILLPSQYILSGDCNFPFVAKDADPDNYTDDTLFGMVPIGHGGQVNILFADSHVLKAKRFDGELMTFSFEEPGKPYGE
jgi:prepilin-type processing-associated H-X9-DG protein